MKKIAAVFCISFFAICALSAQTSPPYNNVSIYYQYTLTRSQFDAITANETQRVLQNANNVVYKSFFEIIDWDYEDDTMVEWVHQNKILPGTTNNRQNGDVWAVYVPRYDNDGWFMYIRWSYDDGYTYLLYYYNRG